ncbi:MAG: PEP-CTERM sorting domain-containing protein [Planctomycetota bacterium]
MACVVLPIIIAAQVQAGVVFSDLSYTSNSLTFTIDGQLSGYATPGQDDQFSIRYESGDVWAGTTSGSSANSWSTPVFDGTTFSLQGNTGDFGGPPYTWSMYTASLQDAVATHRTVTVTFGDNYLNTNALNPIFDFYWGNGHVESTQTFIGSASPVSAVPEPTSMLIFGAGTIGMGLVARRRAMRRTTV